MRNNNPLVTIITVVLNNAKYIEGAIQSILSQKYKNIEHIIIDGGSNDGTVEIINKYSGKISQFISEPDNGFYDALNKGINLSNGDVVGILNSDDEFYDEYSILDVVNAMVKSNAEFCYSDVVLMDKDLEKILRHYRARIFNKWLFRIGWMPPHPACFFRKSVFIEFGGYSTQFTIASDFDFLVRMFYRREIDTIFLNQVLVRMRNGGLSNSGVKSKVIIMREINQSLHNHNIFSTPFFQLGRYFIRLMEKIF
jgi:glycosyltransferase involved in cell wall biosynthesis